jgi:hypothetical protein
VDSLRHILAPLAGAAAIVAILVAFDIPMSTRAPVAVAVGLLVWGGAYFLLKPKAPKTGVLQAVLDANTRAELAEAEGRARTIRDVAGKISIEPVAVSLVRIAEYADTIIGDVRRDPKDYPRLRKPLAHYLKHVDSIADRLLYISRVGRAADDIVQRAVITLKDLELVFLEYNRRMIEDEAFDLDARMALLETEISMEGIDTVGRNRPAGKS